LSESVNQEDQHLKLLVIFHWVVAAAATLVAMFPVFHLVVGIMMVTGRFPEADKQPPMAFFGWFLIAFAAVWIACALCFAICLGLAGLFLSRRRHYVYCLVMAAVACMFVPFGTVLGVFTIIVLTKDSVKARFADNTATPSS
jgi:hypothetical protein